MTPRRFRRLKEVLDRRQPDLAVMLENVHKGHNLSAIVRTCDAVGVLEAHAIRSAEGRLRTTRTPTAGSGKWVRMTAHGSLDEGFAALREKGLRVLAANLSERAVDYRTEDYTVPTAILLGQEKDGVTAEAAARCDGEIVIPMVGMVASLNVSVAAALILFEVKRQREAAGLYDQPRLPPEEYRRLLFEWGYPKLARKLRQEGQPYPELGPEGEVPTRGLTPS